MPNARDYMQITLVSNNGLDRTAVYLWQPKGQIKGVVQVIHGMREHMGRYNDFARFLTVQGYAVIGHDHMGHGRSGSADAAFGYFGEEGGAVSLVKNCHTITRLAQRLFPQKPVFLLGHSMGSLIGRLYILHYPMDIAGFICIGTSGEKMWAPFGRALSEILIKTRGSKTEGKMLDKLTFLDYRRRCRDEQSGMAWLTRDAEIVEKYEWDALIRPYFTNSGFRDLYEIQMAATGKHWASRVDKTLPILLLSGGNDPLGNYGKGVVQVYERLKLAGALDVECKIYEGARHEILNEINKEEVYYDIFIWLEQHRMGAFD